MLVSCALALIRCFPAHCPTSPTGSVMIIPALLLHMFLAIHFGNFVRSVRPPSSLSANCPTCTIAIDTACTLACTLPQITEHSRSYFCLRPFCGVLGIQLSSVRFLGCRTYC
ncbi:hypothetical protein EDB83DRAFT_131740 [Lactarius deliciosus]|nr:hypothetical protein EDB83DRAFT_131740 [Lactarius deliciosus]